VKGLHLALSKITASSPKDVAIYAKEKFAGPFTTLDASVVCRYGEYLSDVVVYRFSQFFARNRNDLYVESPSFIQSLIDMKTREINFENLSQFMHDVPQHNVPTWGERILKGKIPTHNLHTTYAQTTH